MRNFTFLVGCILLSMASFVVEHHAADIDTIRVACLGDSITAGARVDMETESYPARLQEKLGTSYQVKNFGLGGATLIKNGHPNVWQTLEKVEAFEPNIVVISLGTNDTVGGYRKNWEKIHAFEQDYNALIDRLLNLNTKPRLFVCTPTAMVLSTPGLAESRAANLEERQPRLQELCRKIRDLTARRSHKKVTLLELNAVLRNRPEWLTETDGVHPNAKGYDAIARTVANAIQSDQKSSAPPNIVLFLVDDMGWQDTSVPFHSEITPLNRRYRTPNMERLAATGMKFTQAYACSICSPTRVSLMTGLNAARHRVTNWTLRKNASNDRPHPSLDFPKWNVNGLSPIAGVERTVHAKALPQWLREAGYRTIHIGKAHFGAVNTPAEDPIEIGFDINVAGHAAGGPGSFLGTQNFSAEWRGADKIWDVPGLEEYHGKDIFLTEALTQKAVQEMDTAVADNSPFFLYLSHYAVHVPFAEDTRFFQSYLDQGLDKTEAMYAAMVEGMDNSLGDILDRLEQLGIERNTIILFMSDNGGLSASGRGGVRHTHNAPLSSGKGSAHEGGIRVPMLVRWPSHTAPNSICSQPVIIEDFYPTILKMAGITSASQIGGIVDGWSFVHLLQGKKDLARNERPLIWHVPNNWGPSGPGIGPASTIRLGDWKFIQYYDGRPSELFNLSSDLSESRNLIAEQKTQHQRLKSTMDLFLNQAQAQFPTSKQ